MIVMKFGGSSVKNAERIRNVGKVIKSRLDKNPIVVVSALGGITDILIEASKNALEGKETASLIKKVKERHHSTLKELGLDEGLVDDELNEFEELIQRITKIKEVTTETMDHVQSFGERMSSKIIAAHLSSIGIEAEAHNAYEIGIITNGDHGNAEPLKETEESLRNHLSNKKSVPVITGFIAKNKAGKITTLGRGGSDYTAAIVGAALDAEEIQIWTDVNGIMTTDPRIVKEAKTIPRISFEEASELSYFGIKVMHPKTIVPAVNNNIPVRVLNTYEPDNKGTEIVKELKDDKEAIISIACKKGNTLVNVSSLSMINAYGFLAKMFSIFGKYKKSVDMIATSETVVSFTVDNDENMDKIEDELSKIGKVTLEKNKSIICVIGRGMKHSKGVIWKMFKVLKDIRVEMASLGASEINLSFIVDDKDANKVVKKLHKEYF